MFCNIERLILNTAKLLNRDKLQLLMTVTIILAVFAIDTLLLWQKERTGRRKAERYLDDMEMLFEDFRKLRHQYNNIFQFIVFYIENEQWDRMPELKDEILKRASEQNNNVRFQLVKIKHIRIRSILNEIIEQCRDYDISLNIMVQGEINRIPMNEADLSELLRFAADNIICETVKSSKMELIIRISSDSEGVSFVFDSRIMNKPEAGKIYTKEFIRSNPDWRKRLSRVYKIMKRNENMIFNNYMENDYFRQEIMIL